MDGSADIDFKVLLLNIAFRRRHITATQTSRSLCTPAEFHAATALLARQNTHQSKTRRPAHPPADA